MKKVLMTLVLASLVPSVWALTYDQTVTGGVYYGSGNADGGWTVDTANGIELGLRTHQSYPTPANAFNSNGDGTYSWIDQNGNTAGNNSSWNYDFSIYAGQAVTGAPNKISDFTYKLFIDSDPSAGQSWSFYNPTLIPDNARPGFGYGPTDNSSQYAQNSENARYAFVGIPGYDNTIAGTYDFKLQALDTQGAVLAETDMRVYVNGGAPVNAPDAGTTMGMLGFALVGLGALRRKLTA